MFLILYPPFENFTTRIAVLLDAPLCGKFQDTIARKLKNIGKNVGKIGKFNHFN